MRLWRLTRAPFAALDGSGAERHGGRYSPAGLPLVPLASEAGLAVLIAMRYLPDDPADIAKDFVLGWTQVDAKPERMADDGSDEAVRVAVTQWARQERSLLAAVSSRVLPEADVILLNPRHHDAGSLPPLKTRPFDFAQCLQRPPMLSTFRSDP